MKEHQLPSTVPVPVGDSPSAASRSIMVDITLVIPDPEQPRKYFNPEKQRDLERSIKANGVIQPVLIRIIPGQKEMILVAGERRYRAALNVGLQQIPALVCDGDPREISLTENIQREDLLPLEKAESLQKLINEYGYTYEKLGAALSLSKSTIAEILSINRLPDKIKSSIRSSDAGKYPQRLLVAIAKADSPRTMIRLFEKYEKNILNSDQIRKQVRKQKHPPQERLSVTATDTLDIINKISDFKNYIVQNITKQNYEQVQESLDQLYDVLCNMIAGDDFKPSQVIEPPTKEIIQALRGATLLKKT